MKLSSFSMALACTALISTSAFAQMPGGSARAVPVVVSKATTSQFVDRVEAIGTLRAKESIVVASTVTDNVTAINFEDGQRVSKGDILVEMASGEEKAMLDQQKALVNETSKQLQRVKDLAKTGAASASLVDQRQREYTAARAGMAALQSRMEDYIIVAPFDGVVGLRNISVGALLQPATRITTLDDDSVMKLDFSVPSVFLSTLKPGLEIVARASGYKEEYKGVISAIDSQINADTRAILVRAEIPNPDGALKPGLLMSVELLKDPRQGVTIPETAIVPEGRKTFVFVANEAQNPVTVEKREVVIGGRRPGEVEIVENLSAGEKVVVMGTMNVRDGLPVMITAEQEKGDTLQDVLKKAKDKKNEAAAKSAPKE
jgi:membrane fusion protein (multidrug efflux system)